MVDSEKTTAKHLSKGHSILVAIDEKGILGLARIKTGSHVAVVKRKPVKAQSPEPGRRGGYRIDTSLGTIQFVTAVAGVIRANIGDWKRQERIKADSARANGDSQGVLDGLVMTAEDRAKAVKPRDIRQPRNPNPATATPAPTLAAHRPVASPVPAPTAPRPPTTPVRASQPVTAPRVTEAESVVQTGPVTKAMADNYRGQARAATTERARNFWQAKANDAAARLMG